MDTGEKEKGKSMNFDTVESAELQRYIDVFNTKLQSEKFQRIVYHKDSVEEKVMYTFKWVDTVNDEIVIEGEEYCYDKKTAVCASIPYEQTQIL